MYIRFQLVRGNMEEKKEWQIPAGEEGLASLRSGWDTTHHRKGSGGPGQPEGRGPVGRRLQGVGWPWRVLSGGGT